MLVEFPLDFGWSVPDETSAVNVVAVVAAVLTRKSPGGIVDRRSERPTEPRAPPSVRLSAPIRGFLRIPAKGVRHNCPVSSSKSSSASISGDSHSSGGRTGRIEKFDTVVLSGFAG